VKCSANILTRRHSTAASSSASAGKNYHY